MSSTAAVRTSEIEGSNINQSERDEFSPQSNTAGIYQQRHSTSSSSSSTSILISSSDSSGFASSISGCCCSNSLTSIVLNPSNNFDSPTSKYFPSQLDSEKANLPDCSSDDTDNIKQEADIKMEHLDSCPQTQGFSEAQVLNFEEPQSDELHVINLSESVEYQAHGSEKSVEESIKTPSDSGSIANESKIVTPLDMSRCERSNSCSEAEKASTSAAAMVLSSHADNSQNTSSSHGDLHLLGDESASIKNHPTAQLSNSSASISQVHVDESRSSQLIKDHSSIGQDPLSSLSYSKQQQSVFGSSSRFFPSRLNTGSLWSLLSVGSNSSTNAAENQDQSNEPSPPAVSLGNDNAQVNASISGAKSKQQISNYFGRVQFSLKRNQDAIKPPNESTADPMGSSVSSYHQLQNQPSLQLDRKRFKFPVKYIGSAMLHKNFTLPMLEWIVKDIKRQTIKGGSQGRQLPVRDIILEIQAYQLMGINCRDGHCTFVHPMHCVSKYAQLQLDPSCFAYIIRDTKESPQFCHVFQAKSASKVHEIFCAIREATTSTLRPNNTLSFRSTSSQAASMTQESSNRQSLMSNAHRESGSSGAVPARNSSIPNTPTAYQPVNHFSVEKSDKLSGRDVPDDQLNFENSYQFEVMFVKRVKLQCRRVPATFVDDALETLKSFEVLKGSDLKTAQIKGVGKSRGIISISVDERQEYDEACQSPTPGQPSKQRQDPSDELRRNSLNIKADISDKRRNDNEGSRSCQQSPTRHHITSSVGAETDSSIAIGSTINSDNQAIEILKKHQSMDGLDTAPTRYSNDFSPYNTITSTGLNERIAAIPVVSHGSVSLDYETRQRLARQVRETIQAKAANIKKDVYATGGDKLQTSMSLKAIDSLSCTVTSEVPSVEAPPSDMGDLSDLYQKEEIEAPKSDVRPNTFDIRCSSASLMQKSNQSMTAGNNFDAFRRASGRQVIKNRTMLLLIGKDELCAISIDKHQMLFSKSFNQILHCLQGKSNSDHFGLICRDSGKINPNAESHAGFIFKCQSEKVVREIMSALKQVIYSSQHSYHGYYSPYNPFNNNKLIDATSQKAPQLSKDAGSSGQSSPMSLAEKRGFKMPLDIDEANKQAFAQVGTEATSTASNLVNTGGGSPILSTPVSKQSQGKPNLIKSMFCDQCPLYWYHRLCCDLESLPADATKGIILRRIDSSLSEKEQDALYSKFSEYAIDSIEEHNEVFMSLLRHSCESQQAKHSQTQAHLSAMAKNQALVKQQQSIGSATPRNQSGNAIIPALTRAASLQYGHQRSGSTGGSFTASMNGREDSVNEASSSAMDNLKRAKNSISSSIENLLKRRPSTRGSDQVDDSLDLSVSTPERGRLPTRSGSFKVAQSHFSDKPANDTDSSCDTISISAGGNLKRSQSTSDSRGHRSSQTNLANSWRDSFTRTIQDDLANPFVGLFRRRSSTMTVGGKSSQSSGDDSNGTFRTSAECLSSSQFSQSSPKLMTTPNLSASNDAFQSSSMLSSAFWKKSIFDKIRQPVDGVQTGGSANIEPQQLHGVQQTPHKRSKEELRALWKKAILDQITLLKMDRQNQRLVAAVQQNQTQTSEQNQLDRIKLNYKDLPYPKEAPVFWNRALRQDPSKKVQFVEVARLVRLGITKQRRGEVWTFLMNQYQLRHGTSYQPADDFKGDANQSYRNLLSELSVQQHEIFVDIGK